MAIKTFCKFCYFQRHHQVLMEYRIKLIPLVLEIMISYSAAVFLRVFQRKSDSEKHTNI